MGFEESFPEEMLDKQIKEEEREWKIFPSKRQGRYPLLCALC